MASGLRSGLRSECTENNTGHGQGWGHDMPLTGGTLGWTGIMRLE